MFRASQACTKGHETLPLCILECGNREGYIFSIMFDTVSRSTAPLHTRKSADIFKEYLYRCAMSVTRVHRVVDQGLKCGCTIDQ